MFTGPALPSNVIEGADCALTEEEPNPIVVATKMIARIARILLHENRLDILRQDSCKLFISHSPVSFNFLVAEL